VPPWATVLQSPRPRRRTCRGQAAPCAHQTTPSMSCSPSWDCSPITCGNYLVPANSMAWHSKKNASVVVTPEGQLVREVLYDETINISCDPSFHVSFSDFEQCNRNMSLWYIDRGVLVSTETSKPLTCGATKKHVECTSCFKFWGSDSSPLQLPHHPCPGLPPHPYILL
jgi:hypothetical protein